VAWAESSLLTATSRWGNSLLILVGQKLRKKSGCGGNDYLKLGGICKVITLNEVAGNFHYLMPIAHAQLHELLADSCYHAAITPASVQAHYEHEHLLLVLGTQLAIGSAYIYNLHVSIFEGARSHKTMECAAGCLAQAAILNTTLLN